METNKWKGVLEFSPLIFMFCSSLLAWPILFVLNNSIGFVDVEIRAFWFLAFGFFCFVVYGYVASKVCKPMDWFFVCFMVFAFAAICDSIIALENLGFVQGFTSAYIKYGEPHLFCSWGTAACCFDALGFFPMYHIIVFLMTNGKSWRSVGIYWGSGILNSMIVLLVGTFVGKHTPTFCVFLNTPFVLFPIAVLIRAFGTEKRSGWSSRIQESNAFFKFVDIALIIGLLASIWFSLAKGLASFGSRAWPIWNIVRSGPVLFLADPAPFPFIQANIFLFYIIPIQVLSLIYLFKREKPQFLWEMTVIHGGALLQAQFVFLFQCLSPETPVEFRSDWGNMELWLWNLLVLLVPHIYLLRLWPHRRPLEKSGGKQN